MNKRKNSNPSAASSQPQSEANQLERQRQEMANGGNPDDHTVNLNQPARTDITEADRQAALAREHQGVGTAQGQPKTDSSPITERPNVRPINE